MIFPLVLVANFEELTLGYGNIIHSLISYLLPLVHPKGGNLQRKALTDIKNVHQSKTVSFETSKPSMHSTKKTNEKDSKVFTPGPKVIKSSVATPAVVKSNNKVKNVASSFKIFEDNKCATNVKKLSFKNKHQEPDEIEYVAPNTDTGQLYDFLIL